MCFGAGALSAVARAGWPGEDEIDLTAVARSVSAAGGALEVRLADGWRRNTGRPGDLLELNRIALDRLEARQRRQSGDGNVIEGRVKIDARASIRASVIIGPVVIGADARIADAYIGPYTSIGDAARVEGAEIERSIIGAGASIMHVGCRLAGSVIGANARVVREFAVPRAMRLCVASGADVGLC
jgi:glucose-1-phosphate thymidylyltransferase